MLEEVLTLGCVLDRRSWFGGKGWKGNVQTREAVLTLPEHWLLGPPAVEGRTTPQIQEKKLQEDRHLLLDG